MRAIMVMFDSLNRRMLPNYGCDWVKAPNFSRLGRHTVTFDSCWAGSLPCMPARRELHTGRYNFLHRSWGPLEPFDDSMPEILKNNGIYTHLVSDHHHYWEDGGATYHSRYSSWDAVRGQEGDPWKAEVAMPQLPAGSADRPQVPGSHNMLRQDTINRKYMDHEALQPQARTFAGGLEFITTNQDQDNWFLQIETFDPHEPFFTQAHYKALYPHDYDGKPFDWPPYDFVKQGADVVRHARYEYAALLSMCDHHLGKILDAMDQHDMWRDTMLIVNTDHGYLLGEKGWWSKTVMPVYNEVANTPLFCWDPRVGAKDVRRSSLVQTIDIAPTLLDYFGISIPVGMQGKALKQTFADDTPVRGHALFGYHGGQINITDGKTVYMKGPASPDNKPLFEYTLMPCHMRAMFKTDELQKTVMSEPLSFTKGCPVMKIEARTALSQFQYGDRLYDLEMDPGQEAPIDSPQREAMMLTALRQLMAESNAPADEYTRLGIPQDDEVITANTVLAMRGRSRAAAMPTAFSGLGWERAAIHQYNALVNISPEAARPGLQAGFKQFIEASASRTLTSALILAFVDRVIPEDKRGFVKFIIGLAGREM
jgi:arylsulfatase A-like enzyme